MCAKTVPGYQLPYSQAVLSKGIMPPWEGRVGLFFQTG